MPNVYGFAALVEPTTPPTNVATLQRFCKQVGYLLGTGGALRLHGNIGINTGAFVPTNAVTDNPLVRFSIETKFRLPSALEPPQMGATTSGEIVTGGAICAMTLALDDTCSSVLPTLDKTIVTRGCMIVAYVPASVDVSDQVDAQMNIPLCNGAYLMIGRANQDAQMGIYETPFSTATAFAIIGGQPVRSVAVVADAPSRNSRR